ncbi:nucleotide disphospho-sugar-binding domain-containing protein [Kutzneria sp. NPDC052558]|uniref:nucleotide disphospho-sugar-binding domain-containing protein n=1 Tax=Kutzneria sp. NPDC052558 TaxID=3364121 RepID=UPI0037CC6C4E
MRVLFVATGALPHLFPLVPLAWACRAAGHEVRLASTAAVADQLVRTGLPAVVLATATDSRLSEVRARLVPLIHSQPAWPSDWAIHPESLNDTKREYLRLLGAALALGADGMLDDLLSFARHWKPDIVVHDAITYAGEVTAQKLDIPNVKHNFGTATQPPLHTTTPEYHHLFHRHHTAPRAHPTATIDPTPPTMRLPSTERTPISERYLPYNGSGAVPVPRPARSRPRVCVTWGHTSARALGAAAAEPYRLALDAMADLDVQLVVVTTAAQLKAVRNLPPTVWTAPDTPLQLVLPHCDLLVHQGGDGTTLTAASLGVPQLALTRKPDAELVGARIAAAGIGKHLRYQEIQDERGPATVRRAVAELLSDRSYLAAAVALREEIERQPPPAAIEPELAALAG